MVKTAQKIRKVVFPVGGFGTRFLPATKSIPKEMLPVVDKPIIHYAFEEARAAGIEQFIFVTGRNKNTIDNHFDHSYELQTHLSQRGKERELKLASEWLPPAGNIMFTRQQEMRGLGHAIWCARHMVGNEPFAVILADDMVLSQTPCMKQMVDAYSGGINMLGVTEVPLEAVSSYGVVDIDQTSLPIRGRAGVGTPSAQNQRRSKNAPHLTSPLMGEERLVKAKGLVEKPKPENAPSRLSIIGRYILQPEIFDVIERLQPGAGGEIQITDAIAALIGRQDVYGFQYEGTRYDCGVQAGYVMANLAYALARPELGDAIRQGAKELL